MPRVDGDTETFSCQLLDYRQNTCELYLRSDFLGAWPRGFTTHIHYLSALSNQAVCVRTGSIQLDMHPAI